MLIPATIGKCWPPPSPPPCDAPYNLSTTTARVMQPHVQQYGSHSGRYQGSSGSLPVGVLNLATFPAAQNVNALSRAASFAAPVAAAERTALNDEIRSMPGWNGHVGGGALCAPREATSVDGQRRRQMQEATTPLQQQGTRRHLAQQIPRPMSAGAAAAFATTESLHRGRSSPPPRPHPSAASLAPPPPPPVLNAAQQEHLRQLQQHKRSTQQQQQQQQHRGSYGDGRVGGVRAPHVVDRVGQLTETERLLHFASEYRAQHEDSTHSTQEQRRQRHPGVVALPRYANAMPKAPPRCPSPIVKVPIYGSLSEAIEHQQHQQLQQHQHSRSVSLSERPRQVGGKPSGPPPPPPPPPPSLMQNALPVRAAASAAFDALFTQGRQSPNEPIESGRKQHQHREFNDATLPAPGRLSHQQQQRERRSTHILPPDARDSSSVAAARSRSYEDSGRVLAGSHTAPEPQVTMALPLRTAALRQGSSQAPAASAPPAGLRLQMCGPADAPMSAPVTPVMVYAYPHGYMMAYPTAKPLGVETPKSTRSQAAKVCDPYECVSPSGEIPDAGFGPRGKETPPSSLESSRVGSSSAVTVSSHEGLRKPSRHEDASQATRGRESRASPVLSEVTKGGLYDNGGVQQRHNRQPSSSATPRPHETLAKRSKGIEDVSPSTPGVLPRGGAVGSSSGSGVLAQEDKENRHVRAVVGRRGKEGGGNSASPETRGDTQVSGKKRGGGDMEIEKQKSFTGSYFQVSPGSFLQSNKRQRYFA